ncbi:MAG: hypothetical protein NWE76_06055 [Candidatus Bathyarchaeota archaeon]|nr:hypothetical protein [Candidatus Bathyarchaeota archaeon]
MSDYDQLVDELYKLVAESFSEMEKEAISIGGFKTAVGPESSAALLTQVGIPKKKKKKEEGQSLFPNLIKRLNVLIEVMEAMQAPELSDDPETELLKCDVKKSDIISNKMGSWRRINGVPCFICKEGVIHAGPKVFIGKKVATLRDELRAERKKKKKKKNAKSKR